MRFKAARHQVNQHGPAPEDFLTELVQWAIDADPGIFSARPGFDIYDKIKAELGPWESDAHRRAAMIEVMSVLAAFESDYDWKEGVDTSRLGDSTPENTEAGAWQVSSDSRGIAPELADTLTRNKIHNGIQFQQAMKFNHALAMEYIARLLRHSTKANGPLYKGAERDAIRRSLRDEKNSIYPWLSRAAVAEFTAALTPDPQAPITSVQA